jgi:outer membrane protein assembly factor BamB
VCAPLPEPRSSHDAVVIGDRVFVIGGWKLAGPSKGDWHTTAWSADLSRRPLQWRPLPPQPFKRRALAAAAANGRVYAIGGIADEGGTSVRVDVYDLTAGQWRQGPDFPTEHRMKAFGCAAFGVGDTVYASGWDGRLLALSGADAPWRETGVTLAFPRFFHRLLPTSDGRLLAVAGASRRGHERSVEVLQVR